MAIQKSSYLGLMFATLCSAAVVHAQAPREEQGAEQKGGMQPEEGTQPQEGAPQEGMPQEGAKESMKPHAAMAKKQSATAKVEKVDKAKRQLVLKTDEGKKLKVDVPEHLQNFDALKKGDTVRADYFESIVLSLEKGAKGEKPRTEESSMAASTSEQLPEGLIARQITTTAKVKKVDAKADTLTLEGPKGETHTIHITDPEMQSKLDTLKKGDMIKATFTEAIAISVEPQKKEG